MFDLESCLVCPPPFGEQWEVRANYWRRWNQLSIDFYRLQPQIVLNWKTRSEEDVQTLTKLSLPYIDANSDKERERYVKWRWRIRMTNTELQTWGIQTDSNKDAKQIYLFINRWKYCANTGDSSNCYKERENKIWQRCVNLRAPAAQQRPSRLLLQINNIDQRSLIAKVGWLISNTNTKQWSVKVAYLSKISISFQSDCFTDRIILFRKHY